MYEFLNHSSLISSDEFINEQSVRRKFSFYHEYLGYDQDYFYDESLEHYDFDVREER